MNIINFYNEYKYKIIIGIIIILTLIIIFGCIFLPTIFYDNFIWRYFWGPIVSDAMGHQVYYNGIQAENKYTLISEFLYGFIIIIALFGLYNLLKKWNISVNWVFCLSIIPYILAGSVTRVLEDSEFFTVPSVYFFITPIIYFQILLIFLIFLIMGFYIQNFSKNRFLNLNTILFFGGIIFLIPFVYFMIQWIIENISSNIYIIRLDVFTLVILLVFLIVLSVYSFSKFFKKYDHFSIFSKPLNLAMITGHMLDGITSYISIYDPLRMGIPSYYELHPTSNLIMEIWPPLFPIIKFFLIIIVIYVFDVLYKNEFKGYSRLINLLKIGIFILGFAPGLRDLLRVFMGV